MTTQPTTSETVGLIGLGLLGSAIADRLLRGRFSVAGFDVDATRNAALTDAGGSPMSSAGEVFSQCRIVILSLPTSEVTSRLFREVSSQMRRGQTVVDTTTGEPEEMEAHGVELRKEGVDYIEATVAGSSDQMRQGKAVLFLGADEDVMQAHADLLETVAPSRFHLGPVGAASRFKLVHNLVLGLHRAVLAEGLTFAEALGFDAETTLRILQQTPAISGVMATKGEKMVRQDRTPQARLSQHLKDVRLILAAAASNQAQVPLSEVHRTLLERAERLGLGGADNSAIIEAWRAD